MYFIGMEFHAARREEAIARRGGRAINTRMLTFCVLWGALAICLSASRATAQGRAALAADSGNRQNLPSLFDEFRRSRNDIERRSELVDEILPFGKAPATRLHKEISKELEPLWQQYVRDFMMQARQVAKRNRLQIDMQEVANLRETFLATTAKENLTKDDCENVCLPAVTRLREILVGITREEVLQEAPALETRRQAILALADLWRRSYAVAEEEAAATLGTPDDQLTNEENGALMLLTTIPRQDLQVLTENRKLAAKIDAEELHAIDDLNSMRLLLGLSAVLIDVKLCDAARDHSKDMREKNFFAHESPVPGKTSFADRARNFGTTASSENIFVGSTSGASAHLAWFHSPGHHKNMFSAGHRRIGVGRSDKHFTQLFGG